MYELYQFISQRIFNQKEFYHTVLKSFQDQLQADTIKKREFPFKRIDVILATPPKIKLIRPVNKSF